jgi:preprotein translocase subunit SecG
MTSADAMSVRTSATHSATLARTTGIIGIAFMVLLFAAQRLVLRRAPADL